MVNANNVNAAKETTMKLNISVLVALQIANGLDPVAALKAVCGAEAVDQMIANLYTDLRAKGGR